MSPLWTSDSARAATGGRGDRVWQATGVSIDTRTLQPGDLFVALTGENRDGHLFVAEALAKGAAAALVARRPEDVGQDAPLLRVEDTLAGLEALGRAARARSAARIVAVTGSVGKTGSKEALRHLLGRSGPTFASAASYNNHWGVPLTLARMPAASAFAVLEIGMNHPGEITPLTRMARPHVALITTVEAAHLAFFPSVEAIAMAKAEIFRGLEPGGVAVIGRDGPHYALLRAEALAAGAARIVTFGSHPDADIRLLDAALAPERSEVRVALRGREIGYALALPGRHQVQNSLGVLGAILALGGDPAAAASGFAGLPPVAGRGARLPINLGDGDALLIDESYNANPASVRAALEVLSRLPGRHVAVLGDMLELGPAGPALHADLAPAVDAAGVERLFTCGPLMQHLSEAVDPKRRAGHVADSAALVPELRRALRPGDVVLVKGSLGSRMGRVVQALRAGG